MGTWERADQRQRWVRTGYGGRGRTLDRSKATPRKGRSPAERDGRQESAARDVKQVLTEPTWK